MQINRNMSAVVANNQLLGIEERLSASIERLSSGLKINRASDNPAGMAISNKMKAQIDALDQAEANAADGISVVQIADGALNEVSSILQRMRELSVQAANGINSFNDRKSMQDEVDELVKEVDRISSDTEYNTKKLLDGSSNVRVYGDNGSRYQVSDSVDAKIYSLNVESVATQATVAVEYEVPQVEGSITINGVEAKITRGMTREAYLETVRNAATEAGCSVKLEGNQMLIHSDYYGYEEEISVTVTEELAVASGITTHEDCVYVPDEKVYKVDTTGVDAVVTIPTQLEASGFTTTTTVECDGNRVIVTDNDGFSIDFLLDADYKPTADAANGNFEIDVTDIGSLTIQIGANEYQTMDVRIDEISAYTLYLDTVDVAIENGADRAMNTLDDAIAKVSASRSRIGAFQNRLEYAEKSLSSSVENITAAYSGLLDTDMAEEMSEYTQQNILNQAAISVLSQANELPQQILSMLQ
ncbi:MAG: flagellin [Agathobacter sp.]|nr:flagellin [Agathobacter sp.]